MFDIKLKCNSLFSPKTDKRYETESKKIDKKILIYGGYLIPKAKLKILLK